MATYQHNTSKVNTKVETAIRGLLTDRPIAYHAILAKAVGSATAGIFLSQFLYWTPRSQDKDGWIYKTQDDIYGETALTRWEQESARKKLRSVGVLVEKRAGVPSRLYFRINMDALVDLLGENSNREDGEDNPEDPENPDSPHDVGKPHRTMRENHILESGNSSDKIEGKPHTIYETENTTEITTESNVVVVNSLQNFGVSKSSATKLAKTYPEQYIRDKLEFTEYLVSTGSPLVKKNPAGFLRRAIEEDYEPPKDFETTSQRQAREAHQQKTTRAAAVQRRLAEEQFHQAREQAKQHLLDQHPPQPVGEDGLDTQSAWNLTLDKLQSEVPKPTFETWLKDTLLLNVAGNTAHVMVPSTFAGEWLERRMYQSIARTLGNVLQQEVGVEFVAAQPAS